MLTYFFHVRNGHDLMIDPEGRELDSLTLVKSEALREARALIAAEALDGAIKLDQRIEVENDTGAVVHRLNFWDAVDVTRPDKS